MDFRGLSEHGFQPLVTTVVLCYNQARFVNESLKSVHSQTYKNIQLIIIDDASSDDSVPLIRQWIKEHSIECTFVAHERNMGICKTLNEALSYAQGKYITMLASDDLWMPEKTQNQVALMEKLDSDTGVLYSDALLMNDKGSLLHKMFIERHRAFSKIPDGNIFLSLVQGNFIPAMTTLIRRDCYKKVGSYDESLVFEDWDMWLRLSQHYKFAFSPFVSAKYRVVSNSAVHKLTTTLKCDFFISHIITLLKCRYYEKHNKRSFHILGNELARYANGLYKENCKRRNRYLLMAVRSVPRIGSFVMYACSILGLRHSFYLMLRRILIHLRDLLPRKNNNCNSKLIK